jgi:hypothetical protein
MDGARIARVAVNDALIQFSTLEEAEKRRALSLWEKRWSEFVRELVRAEGMD